MEYLRTILDILEFIGTPVCKYFQYHRKFNDYIQRFKRTREELQSKKEDIELTRSSELHQVGKIPRKEVETWLKNVKKMISDAEDVDRKINKGRYLCRPYLGKLVDEQIQEMQNLLDKGPGFSKSLVVDASTSSVGLPLPMSPLVGEKVVKEKIWSYLMHEEVSKIAVCGLGGIGKTTMMTHIHNELLGEKKFDKVIWVTISKDFDVVKLQNNIAAALNADLPKEGDKVRRAALLSNLLKAAKRYVLILDDVWDKISLNEVGIPEPTSNNGCKLVLTSRSRQVCNSMGFKVIKVKPLSEEEALTLFLNKVGLDILHVPTLESTLKLVVKECAGLPLTINVVACSLRGEDDPRLWANALSELKERAGKGKGIEDEVIERLKFSYDHLKDEQLKHCFLYCVLFPEDFEIPKKELIEYWIVEGMLDEMETREAMKNKGYAVLKRLEDNCLLENAGIYRDHVKMHDAVRDMALSITSKNPRYMVKAGMQLKQLPEEEEWAMDVVKISLMENSIQELLLPVKCERLTTLLLRSNPIIRISDLFFFNMSCLRVLDLSDTYIECLPNSMSDLKNLTALSLHECYNLRHLPRLSKLLGLKKLDLGWTRLKEVPQGLEMLVNLKYLDLNVVEDITLPVGLLPKLSRLQYLKLPLGERSYVKAEEVVQSGKLEHFRGCFKDFIEFNKYVQLSPSARTLSSYKIHIGPNIYRTSSFYDKVIVINDFRLFGDAILLPTDVQDLRFMNSQNLRSLSEVCSLKNVVDLRSYLIWGCKGFEFVFSSLCSSWTSFHTLEELSIHDSQKLSELIKEEGFAPEARLSAPPGTFLHLKIFYMYTCSNIRKLFPYWLLTNLQNLEEIKLWNCEQLVEVMGAAIPEDEHDEKGIDTIQIILPKLRKLELVRLPELKGICGKSGILVCDSLEYIEVRECEKLKRFLYLVPCLTMGNHVLHPLWRSKQARNGGNRWNGIIPTTRKFSNDIIILYKRRTMTTKGMQGYHLKIDVTTTG